MPSLRPSFPSRAAMLSVLLAASALPAVARAQTPPATTSPAAVAAQARFDRARALFQQDHFAEALPEFRGSLELFRSPNTRLYVGLCLQRLGRLAEAYVELARTASEAGGLVASDRRYEGARDLARRAVAEIEPRVAQLAVHVVSPPPGVTVRVGRAALDPTALGVALPYDPGEVTVVAEAPGFLASQQSVRLTAGGRASIELALQRAPASATLPPPDADRPPSEPAMRGGGVRVAGFVVGGVGVASLVTFAVLGVTVSNRFHDLQMVCPQLACGGAQVQQIDGGAQLTTVANVALGLGIGALVAGVVMVAVGGPRRVEERTTVYVDPTVGTAGVRGVF